MANNVFPQLATALYHTTSKRVDCANILSGFSNLPLSLLFVSSLFLTLLKHCK